MIKCKLSVITLQTPGLSYHIGHEALHMIIASTDVGNKVQLLQIKRLTDILLSHSIHRRMI